MSLQCINPSPLLAQFLVRTEAFADHPMQVIDVGARDGFEPYWEAVFKDQVRLLGFEPDVEECARLNQALGGGSRAFLPYALHADKAVRDFYVTAFPPSRGFYQPDAAFWNRFADQVNLALLRTVPVETHDLSSVLRGEAVRLVDFIKLDTEGCELDILRGATDLLDRSVLGVSVEVEFSQVHHDQPLFSDVDIFLRRHKFELMDLSAYKHPRLALPKSLAPHAVGRGQLLWGQALYLRDAVRELSDPDKRGDWDPVRVLKMASLFDLFSLQDCAAELVREAAAHGLWTDEIATEYLDCVASSSSGLRVTYDSYFALLVIRDLPRFLQSVSDTQPGTTAALAQIADHLTARRMAVAVSETIDRFRFLLDDEAKDTAGLWLRLYFRHLVKYQQAICDLYDQLESYERSRETLQELRSADLALHASLGHEPAASSPAEDVLLLRANIAAHLAALPRRRIVCYGAGSDFTNLMRSGVFRNHTVVAIVDNYRAKGDRVDGIPVVRHTDLRALDCDVVVVTSARWAGELRTAAIRWAAENAPSIPVI